MAGKYFYLYEDALSAYNKEKVDDKILNIYYYGQEDIQSDIANIIYIPLDNLYNIFLDTTLPYPSTFNFRGIPFSTQDELDYFGTYVNEVGKNIIETRGIYEKQLISSIKNISLFENEQLKVFMFTNKSTKVLQHLMKNIKDSLSKIDNVEVNLIVYDQYELVDTYNLIKELVTFKANVLFLANEHFKYFNDLPDDIFRFVWVQDPFDQMYNDQKIDVRKRDIFYSLIKPFDKYLEKKGINPLRQSFCVNTDLFRIKKDIKKEDKLIFIGSSYINHCQHNEKNLCVINKLKELYFSEVEFDDNCLDQISKECDIQRHFLELRILPYVIRDFTLEYICGLGLDLQIEVYGEYWDYNEIVKPYYKGVLKYGEDLVDAYNSAKYSLAPHSDYVLQQRVLESAACGCIPIVYDCTYRSDDPDYSDSLIYFKKPQDIIAFLKNGENKNLLRIVDENSYDTLAKRVYNTVKNEINK